MVKNEPRMDEKRWILIVSSSSIFSGVEQKKNLKKFFFYWITSHFSSIKLYKGNFYSQILSRSLKNIALESYNSCRSRWMCIRRGQKKREKETFERRTEIGPFKDNRKMNCEKLCIEKKEGGGEKNFWRLKKHNGSIHSENWIWFGIRNIFIS